MSVELEKNAGRCVKCGGRVCICSIESEGKDLWTAHCMECDQKIGDGNGLSYHCENAQDAAIEWELLNAEQEDESKPVIAVEAGDTKQSMKMAVLIVGIGILFVLGVLLFLKP